MSTTKVCVEVKGLLSKPDVNLRAALNGDVFRALKELSTLHPDVHYVESTLKPVLLIHITGWPGEQVVTVDKDQVVFSCGHTFLRWLFGYCVYRDLKYTIVEGK